MVAYDVEGNAYPCQFFMPNSIGSEKCKKLGEIELPDLTEDSLLDAKCRECSVKAICIICYGANYAATGSPYLQDPAMCQLNKIIFKARSYYQAMRWKHGQLSNMDATDLDRLLMSIKIIQTTLN